METKDQANTEQAIKRPRNVCLTVTVEASKLYFLPPTEPNVDAHTALTSDDGLESRFGDRNKNFETGVYLNYNITWDIKLSDKNGVDKNFNVGLYSVYHNPVKYNPNFFDKPELFSKDKGKTIVGTVVNAPLLPDIDENYTIYFWITENGGTPSYFPLDPKLRVRT